MYVCASAHEGAPLPVLEAAACGPPVISTAAGIVPELVRDGVNGLIVERNVEAISAALRRLRDDRDLLRRMGHESRRAAERDWTWAVRIGDYVRMFDAVIAGARRWL